MPKILPSTFQKSLGYGGKKVDEEKAIKILHRVGVDAVSSLDETPIEVAAMLGNHRVLKLIIESLKNDFPEGFGRFNNALYGACYQKRLDCIQLLVEEGADVEHLNSYGHSALATVFIHTFTDPLPIANYLIGRGAQVTDKVIELGMEWNSVKFTELLDNSGIDFDRNLIPEKAVIAGEVFEPELIDIVNLHNCINDKNYFKTLKVMWHKLVPRSGQAMTVQGELLRAIEKLRDEAQRNGNGNFNKNCHVLLIDYLKKYLLDETIFEKDILIQSKKNLKQISYKTVPYLKDDIYNDIGHRIVDWYMKNPTLLMHEKNEDLCC